MYEMALSLVLCVLDISHLWRPPRQKQLFWNHRIEVIETISYSFLKNKQNNLFNNGYISQSKAKSEKWEVVILVHNNRCESYDIFNATYNSLNAYGYASMRNWEAVTFSSFFLTDKWIFDASIDGKHHHRLQNKVIICICIYYRNDDIRKILIQRQTYQYCRTWKCEE